MKKGNVAAFLVVTVIAAVICIGSQCTPEETVIIAYGDSMVSGWLFFANFMLELDDMLMLPEEAIYNAGFPGELAANSLERMKRLFEENDFPKATHMLLWSGGDDLMVWQMMTNPELDHPADPDDPMADGMATGDTVRDAVTNSGAAGSVPLPNHRRRTHTAHRPQRGQSNRKSI